MEDNSRHYDENKHVRLAFYTNIDGIKKRQVIALQGFMVNALMVAIGAKVYCSGTTHQGWLNEKTHTTRAAQAT
ncbi:MAG: hypothetical protein NTV00_07915 [Methylococcales bacterium]|nr:hypothetical protein [Methylococcales bacterium]